MKSINVITRSDVKVSDLNLECVVVDGGLEYAINNNLKILMAIGDFDSVKADVLSAYHGPKIVLNSIKDESDFKVSLNYLKDFKGQINVYGVLGKRFDHSLANLIELFNCDLNLHYFDEYNHLYKLAKGEHIVKSNDFKYLSFLTLDECNLTLKGFKYPLNNYHLTNRDTLPLSNELTEEKGSVIVNNGNVLIIMSND